MLSIIVLSRSADNLEKLLDSILASDVDSELEILVSWNGKTEPPYIRTAEHRINVAFYVVRPYNFAQNNNLLAKSASGEFILFLNDDIVLDKSALRCALREIEKPGIGIVGANLRYPTQMTQHAGIFFSDDLAPFHRHKNSLHYLAPEVASDLFVPAVTGAFLMMRTKEFLAIQFDERFRVAGEDVALNLAYRAKFKQGVLYCADATAIHYENVTRKETNERETPAEDLELIRQYATQDIGGVPIISVKRPRVRIVTEKEGWIMHRKAAEIQKHFGDDYVKINADWADADIHYYINYGYFNRRPASGAVVANFTHYDPDLHADKFVETAFQVDHCTSVSELTSRSLLELGVALEKITTIRVGADERFRPRLMLGISGRVYKGGRKGDDLLKGILEDPVIAENCRFFATSPDWGVPVLNFDNPEDFYSSIDYLLVTSRIEGGPVPVMEALACGTLSIAPPIGVIPEFPHIPYETGSAESLRNVLHTIIHEMRLSKGAVSKSISRQNWDGWSVRHEKLFRRLRSDLEFS